MNLVSITVLAFSAAATTFAQNDRWTKVFVPGEELKYRVSWQFVRLGTIIVQAENDTSSPNPAPIKITMQVESNPAIGFIWIREQNISWIDPERLISLRFRAVQRNDEDVYRLRYDYDTTLKKAECIQIDANTGKRMISRTFQNVEPYVEGPSLVFLTRCRAQSVGFYTVPTLVNGEIRSTELDFRGEEEEIEVPGIDYPVRSRVYHGMANWDNGGSAGLSGEFRGWASDDDASVILRADMKVILGSISMELEEWHRPGWIPPAGHSALVNDGAASLVNKPVTR